ncbi:hypothetical protein POP12_188 [Pectobacterium phage POP12]|nr:hypothetical protein POP12_188 [Pectobacterium phage POP12]
MKLSIAEHDSIVSFAKVLGVPENHVFVNIHRADEDGIGVSFDVGYGVTVCCEFYRKQELEKEKFYPNLRACVVSGSGVSYYDLTLDGWVYDAIAS